MTIPDKTEIQMLLKTPAEVMQGIGVRAKALRLERNLTQGSLAARVGISVGTLKRFEKSGEIQLSSLLRIALVLDRLNEFDRLLRSDDAPRSLFEAEAEEKKRQRGRRK